MGKIRYIYIIVDVKKQLAGQIDRWGEIRIDRLCEFIEKYMKKSRDGKILIDKWRQLDKKIYRIR